MLAGAEPDSEPNSEPDAEPDSGGKIDKDSVAEKLSDELGASRLANKTRRAPSTVTSYKGSL